MTDYSNYTKEDYLKLYDKPLDELIKISHVIILLKLAVL